MKACQLIFTLKPELEYRRNSGVINYNEEVEKLCEKCSINIEKKQRRSHRPPEALNDYVVTDAVGNSTAVNSQIPLHTDIFIPALGCILTELDRRFSSDAKVIMHGIQGVSALLLTCVSFF